MAIIQYLSNIFKRIRKHELSFKQNKLKTLNLNTIILFFFIVIFSSLYLVSSNLISKRDLGNKENLSTISKSSEFSRLTNFFITKINSPYKDIKYTIKKK